MAEKAEKSGFERLEMGAGSILFKEGDTADAAFLIEHGKVEITIRELDRKVALNVLGRGELFGEMALIAGKPRMATAAALTDVSLLVIDRDTFEARIAKMDPVMSRVLTTLTQKLHALSERHAREMVKFR